MSGTAASADDLGQIDVLKQLSDLSDSLAPQQINEEYTVLRPALANLYQMDRARFSVAANLVKQKLKIGRRDLEASIKPLQEDGGEGERTIQSARFPGLVDLVEDDGEVRFLVVDDCIRWCILLFAALADVDQRKNLAFWITGQS